MSFIDSEKGYDRIKREALWHVLEMYDVGVNSWVGIKSMHPCSFACVRVKWLRLIGLG